jgi:putative membrane protein
VKSFLRWLVTTAIGVAVAAQLLDGIRFGGPTHGEAELKHKVVPLLLVALILGLVNSLVRPVLTILSIPLIIVTLGLFLLVLNALMLKFTSWLAGQLDIGFHVRGFWPAVGGAIIITLVGWVVDAVVGENKR